MSQTQAHTQTLLLQDRVVVVTGAASGIGAAVAQLLAARGVRLALIDRNAEQLAEIAAKVSTAGAQARTYVLDLALGTGIEDLAASVQRDLGPAAVLINNAGIALAGGFEQVSQSQFDRVMAINFHAPVAMTRAFLPQLRASAPAQIVNISSLFGLVGVAGQVAYCSSKFAIRGFSEAIRGELAPAGIGVTVVHPGGVRTHVADSAEVGEKLDPSTVEAGRKTMNRFLTLDPAEAARIIVRGLERRQQRIIVGKDAERMQLIQRVMPVGYSRYLPGGR